MYWKLTPVKHPRSGFTLIELLTALAVLGIASTILLRMFSSSQNLAGASRTHEVAAQAAEELLIDMQQYPEFFVWPNYLEHPVGEALTVTPRESAPITANFIDLPNALPTIRRAYNRDRNLYGDFTWEAWARLPSADAHYVEIGVDLEWTLQGRLRRFTLSSAVPREDGEGTGL